ncbi:B3 domain-containing protein Os03g0619800-like [Lolium rigidum]|uniref:B3 domain-containing protein Os03g0619800-like n=1 Tax=Lolium rigidum TaxID=89674 RepID=UPI001F5D8734|nr:B3 domain-containing protein Os03g0619800-like [Lolium rigidum]
MRNSCEGCKRYWNHLHGKVTRFVRRMNKNSRKSLIIPERFGNYFVRKMPGTIELEGPNGKVYDVGVTKHKDITILQSGWEVFVDANNIVEKDSLMFRYHGRSRFKVAVFDSGGCEKRVSCAGIESDTSNQERSKNYADMSSSSSDHNTRSSVGRESDGCQNCSSGRCRKWARTDATSSSSEDFSDSPSELDDHTLPKMASTVRVKEEQSDGEDSALECDSSESDDVQTPPEHDYVLSLRSYLTEEQKEKVVMLLRNIQPRTLAFVAIMKKSSVEPPHSSLTISKKYAVLHFPHESASVTLQRAGVKKKWHPRFYKTKNASMHKIRGEWCDFVCENHVEEGDICIFVPAKNGRRFTFTVHLLHAESNTHAGPFVPPYILAQNSCLSPLQQSIIEDKLQAIQLEAPLYVAIMNNTSAGVNGRYVLEFGAQYAAVYLPNKEQTILLQRARKIWHTKLRIWSGRRRVLHGGWRKFVRENCLHAGDICLFELKNNWKELKMRVHIITSDQC